jgi:hypothetical protein
LAGPCGVLTIGLAGICWAATGRPTGPGSARRSCGRAKTAALAARHRADRAWRGSLLAAGPHYQAGRRHGPGSRSGQAPS